MFQSAAACYASSFSAALSTSVNRDESQIQEEKEKRHRENKSVRVEKLRDRRPSLNTLLGLSGVHSSETADIVRSHIYIQEEKKPEATAAVIVDDSKAKKSKKKSKRFQLKK